MLKDRIELQLREYRRTMLGQLLDAELADKILSEIPEITGEFIQQKTWEWSNLPPDEFNKASGLNDYLADAINKKVRE